VSEIDSVPAIFESYLAQDRNAAEQLLAEASSSRAHKMITSTGRPPSSAVFLQRTVSSLKNCFMSVPTEGDDVFVMYEYELKTGDHQRNVEVLTIRGERIAETQVFFGGRVR
jgi:hypothetical protein